MYLHIIALDLDGTLALHDTVAPETWAVLRQARAAGFELILVTGRRLEVLPSLGPFDEIFQAIVAENGAAVYYPRTDVVVLPFGRVAPEVADRLEALQVPLERGLAIAATWEPYTQQVSEVLAATGYAAAVEYNKGAVMVLPPGASKGTGLMVALQELGGSPRNLIACGDAENDRSMFNLAEVAVAVANAAPGITELADVVLPEENGAGIQRFLQQLVRGELPCTRTRPDRRISLGHTLEGTPVYLSPVTLLNGNLGIIGDSGTGKSWLAGLLVEHLLRLHYPLCIIDPEGDYRALRSFPHTLLLGGDETPPPPVADVVTLFEYSNISLILDLSLWERTQQVEYVTELLHGLFNLRARCGQPHWFLIDEVQYFCPAGGGPLTDLITGQLRQGGIGIVSYRPAQIAPAVLQLIGHWLVTHVEVEESRQLGGIWLLVELSIAGGLLGAEKVDGHEG